MNNIPNVFWLVPVASIVALGMAWYFFKSMISADEGTPRMREIAKYVRDGAMAYLWQQYKVVGIVFVVLCALFAFMAYGLDVQNRWVPFAFLTGGLFSGLAGFFGMKTATYASGRTANAARKSLDAGLKIAFRSGAVMGLTVVGLGLLDIAIWFVILNRFDPDGLISITTTMLTFGMGASTQALFARVGGGIYTKAADVGADIVGKVEADIPEDDPRNPATIADNVGDNVGDVAGMGADLYESYCGSILSTAALGAAAFIGSGLDVQLKAVIAPMLIAAVGVFLSILGIYLVRTKEGATMRDLLRSLSLGTNVSAMLIAVATFAILYLLDRPAEKCVMLQFVGYRVHRMKHCRMIPAPENTADLYKRLISHLPRKIHRHHTRLSHLMFAGGTRQQFLRHIEMTTYLLTYVLYREICRTYFHKTTHHLLGQLHVDFIIGKSAVCKQRCQYTLQITHVVTHIVSNIVNHRLGYLQPVPPYTVLQYILPQLEIRTLNLHRQAPLETCDKPVFQTLQIHRRTI